MQFCQRYPEIIARFDRFWAGADTDRPVLFLTAPKDQPDTSVPPPPELARPEDRVLPEHMLASVRYRLARGASFAEAYPHFFMNFGPGVLHACIGGEADLSSMDTTWFPQFLSDLSEFPALRFDPQGKWWQAIARSTNALLEELGEEIVVSFTDLGGAADILASAIGTEQLLLDVIERPELAKRAVAHCHALWMQAYEANYRWFVGRQDVTTPWWPVLSRGRTYMTQCDFNAMVSPQVFASLFADELGGIYQALDNGCFHLDGIGTEVHVPALLALEGLHCVQWVPAPGTSALRHKKMLREIQEAGVGITFAIRPEEVELACREFDHRRLYLVVSCDSEKQARELLGNALRWCE
jgi:hypothetical protein